jgi:hypothetical protein
MPKQPISISLAEEAFKVSLCTAHPDSPHFLQAIKYLQQPEDIRKLVDPELTYARTEDLAVICSVVSRCIDPDASKRPSMQIIAGVMETGIVLSTAGIVKESSLA